MIEDEGSIMVQRWFSASLKYKLCKFDIKMNNAETRRERKKERKKVRKKERKKKKEERERERRKGRRRGEIKKKKEKEERLFLVYPFYSGQSFHLHFAQ